MQELEACQLVQCYEVEQQRYFHLCRWQEWQKLNKRTPSKYPAPPTDVQEPPLVEMGAPDDSEEVPTSPDFSGEISEKSGKEKMAPTFPGESQKRSLEGEGEEEYEQEHELEGEDETHQSTPNKVIAFPGPSGIGTAGDEIGKKTETLSLLTKQLAGILKLPASEALQRLVEEYQQHPHLSLQGQADAAREWVDKQKGRQMSIRFFRHWLEREEGIALARQKQQEQQYATGTTGSQKAPAPPAYKSLMNLEKEYQQKVKQGKEIHHG